MMQLYGPESKETRLFANILTLKGGEFERKPEPHDQCPLYTGAVLQDHSLILRYPSTILFYLENKMPFPTLLSEDVDRATIIYQIYDRVVHDEFAQDELNQLISSRRPFILGEKISLIDCVVDAAINDPDYHQDIHDYAIKIQGPIF